MHGRLLKRMLIKGLLGAAVASSRYDLAVCAPLGLN